MESKTLPEASLVRLLDHVRRRAKEYFPDVKKIEDVRIRRTRRRAYSDIYLVSIRNGRTKSRELIIKVCADAALQFRAMMAVWAHFAEHPCWRIPQPLDYLEDDHALVMEAVGGIPLQARIPWTFWRGESMRSAEKDCNRAGQWLRFYHDLDRTNDFAPLDVINGRGLEETLEELLAAPFNRNLHHQVASFLQLLAARLTERSHPVSHVHGDFTVDNILVDEGHVTALDLWAVSRNIIDHDIASFLNSLLLMRLSSPAPRSVLNQLREAFLVGYFGQGPRDESAIVLLQVKGLADVALEIIARRRSVLARLWVEHVVAHAIGTLTQGFGES